MAHDTAMVQLFQNLISNSIKFIEKDKFPRITISTDYFSEYCSLKITDNGIGISKEFLSRVFDPFFRLHSVETYKGSGLGLATYKKIMDHYSGALLIESIPEHGSTFSVQFPLFRIEAQSIFNSKAG